MTTRYAKILMVLSLAAFAFMVTFNNVTDYGSNFAFVQHVLSMDTTFPDNAAMYRAVTNPLLWHLGYWLIIAGEGLTLPPRTGSSRARPPASSCGSSASW